jgi:hypothetical protein
MTSTIDNIVLEVNPVENDEFISHLSAFEKGRQKGTTNLTPSSLNLNRCLWNSGPKLQIETKFDSLFFISINL